MRKKIFVSPSTDPISPKSKNFEEKIVAYAKDMLEAGADFLHCDIMDGDFVKATTYDFELVKKINDNCLIPLDVHLMVRNPSGQIEDYINAGANFLTVHYEAFDSKDELVNVLKVIREYKLLSGLSFKPKTPVEKIEKFLKHCDIVMIMSVNPGMSGKKFIPESLDKIKQLDEIRKRDNLKFMIEIDGGINSEKAKEVKKLGVDIIVSGNFIYTSEDKKLAISSLR